MTKKIWFLLIGFIMLPSLLHAAVTDMLILEDIAPYKLFTGVQGRAFSGPPFKFSQSNTGGILDASGHFAENDISYGASYTEPNGRFPFVKVEVTQHAGSDSDQWLLHEGESSFRGRTRENHLGESVSESTSIRELNGNKLFDHGNIDYRWISNNIVVYIHYTDLDGTKPEPLEVVNAYLAKHPSTITLTDTELKSAAHSELWIKDEMDRRLWLTDKWFLQIQTGKATQDKVLREAVDHMNVFLDYRDKYFGVGSGSEKRALSLALQAKDGGTIKAKFTEYKTWWGVNKDKSISLP